MIGLVCSQCSHRYRVDEKYVGRRIKCRNCGSPMLVAASDVATAFGPPPAAASAAAVAAVIKDVKTDSAATVPTFRWGPIA